MNPKLTQPMEQYKREHWCAKLRIPESGNPELDAMIRKALRRDLAAMAMQGSLGGEPGKRLIPENLVKESVFYADGLLAALATPPEGGER